MRILVNQDRFKTHIYLEYGTPLVEALNKHRIFKYFVKMRKNGFLSGLLMYFVSRNFDVVQTMGHRPAIAYGLACRLLGGGQRFMWEANSILREDARAPP